MKTRLRKEEYTALGDFILPSFVRDQATIVAVFPKFDDAFLNAFTTKLAFVKQLESSLIKTEEQKGITSSLYQTAADLNAKLTVMNSYIADADLSTAIITNLKNDIYNRKIEGAILKIEALIQYITSNQRVLEAEGMPRDFATTLTNYKVELETKNGLQNQYMNSLKQLTETNGKHYEELYGFIAKIANKGKLVFKNTVIQDEYTITKSISRMRAAKVKDNKKDAA